MGSIGMTMLLLNKLSTVDKIFFWSLLGIIVAIVAVYFLIPVFKKSQYEERRENLRKREAAFKSGRAALHAAEKTDEVASENEPTSKVTDGTEE